MLAGVAGGPPEEASEEAPYPNVYPSLSLKYVGFRVSWCNSPMTFYPLRCPYLPY